MSRCTYTFDASKIPPAIQPPPTSQNQSPHPNDFRFTPESDVELLKVVAEQNPYAVPRRLRLLAWQTVADTLRLQNSSFVIDYRRARDRTALLLMPWEIPCPFHSAVSCTDENSYEAHKLLQRIFNMKQDLLSLVQPTSHISPI